MAEVPLELPTGRVVGKFIFEVQDNNDPDEEPQLVPVIGDVTIKSAIDNLTIFDQSLGKFVTFRGPHKAVINSAGELSTPHPDTGRPMYTGMSLWSNDSDNLSVKGWTYTATFNLKTADGKALNLQPVTFTLATGQEVDLADVVKVPATPGYGLPQAEGAALRAEAAAQVALDVKAMADAGEFDGAQGLPGNATMRVDTSVGKRVFISDGGSEHLVLGDTDLRDITTLASGVTSGKIYVQRENSLVTLTFDTVLMGGATGTSYIMIPTGGIPSGFRPPLTFWYNNVDGPPAKRRIGVTSTGALVVYLTPLPDDRYTGTISWRTRNPWPTVLPGTPV